VRETVAITAYALGDFALAVRELRTYRRISGRDDQIALLVDSERGSAARPCPRSGTRGGSLDVATEVRVELAIAMSGARLDLGETSAHSANWTSPSWTRSRLLVEPGTVRRGAAVLEELGRVDEAQQWQRRAEVAAEALGAVDADLEVIEIDEIEEIDDAIPPVERRFRPTTDGAVLEARGADASTVSMRCSRTSMGSSTPARGPSRMPSTA
jgi:hypothetical protein